MSDYLHIVSLDAPSPPDYGGVFDLYYKVPALAKTGKKIILHYFKYKENRGHEGLENYCEEINSYNRTAFLKSLLTLKPYIVSSRIETELIHRLNRDDHPVLLEGIHCTGLIPHLSSKRKILVRVHNNEAEYYKQLLKNEPNLLKAFYFLYESSLLSFYQKKLSTTPEFLFVSETDMDVFKTKYHQSKQVFVPCFVPWQNLNSLTGRGTYCLYHGNMNISENSAAAKWLAEFIFPQINMPLIIAGKNAAVLENELSASCNIQLVNDPSDEELTKLIQNAHINVLPSFNTTGVKLKLIHAAFEGRFCLTNEAGIEGSGLLKGIQIANDNEAMIERIKELASKEFTEVDCNERSELIRIYNNDLNAERLNALL